MQRVGRQDVRIQDVAAEQFDAVHDAVLGQGGAGRVEGCGVFVESEDRPLGPDRLGKQRREPMRHNQRRAAARALWARGDYATFGDLLAPVGAALCARIGVSDLDVLDVGTGTGSTALAAAGAGGRVSGADLTPELLAVARRRAEAEELPVEWREGNAVSLPYGRRVQLDP